MATSAVASLVNCATDTLTWLVALSDTSILPTWVLALMSSSAPPMAAAVSTTVTVAGVVPLAWNRSAIALASLVNWATDTVTWLVALSDTTIFATWLLPPSMSSAATIWAAEMSDERPACKAWHWR